jgi:hypothetical protein
MSENVMNIEKTTEFRWWLIAVAVLGAILMAIGGVIALIHPAMLVSPKDEINGAVQIYAGYFAARNLALAIMLIAALSMRTKALLNHLMLFAGVIQLFDTVLDCVEGRWTILPGVIILALLFFAASWKLSKYPVWRREAWR